MDHPSSSAYYTINFWKLYAHIYIHILWYYKPVRDYALHVLYTYPHVVMISFQRELNPKGALYFTKV